MTALEMRKDDLRDVSRANGDQPLKPGQARLSVRRFALTANNVTYAVFGDAMAYWAFFPASEADRGRVPVWGFAVVTESRADGLDVGRRVYGYFPLGDTLVVEPGRMGAHGFSDMAAHRQPMAPVYNRYEFTTEGDAETEGRIALLKPLFTTGFLIDDWLGGEGHFGAGQVICSAASSKTALSAAACLKARGGARIVGLTSARSAGFVTSTGLYDDVVTYDSPDRIAEEPAVYVDFAGDAETTHAVHARLGSRLVKSVIVGGAHWDAPRQGPPPVGPAPELFFAPTHVGRLGAAWGAAEFTARVDAGLAAFAASSADWMRVVPLGGLEQAAGAWLRLLDGAVGPDEGLVVELEGLAGSHV